MSNPFVKPESSSIAMPASRRPPKPSSKPAPAPRGQRGIQSVEVGGQLLRALADELGEKPRQAFEPIRLAVTGSKVSPGLFESLELLGREESLKRLSAAAAAPAA